MNILERFKAKKEEFSNRIENKKIEQHLNNIKQLGKFKEERLNIQSRRNIRVMKQEEANKIKALKREEFESSGFGKGLKFISAKVKENQNKSKGKGKKGLFKEGFSPVGNPNNPFQNNNQSNPFQNNKKDNTPYWLR